MTARLPALSDLEQSDDFIERHIGPSAADRARMLDAIGLPDMETLIERAVPGSIRLTDRLNLMPPRTEAETLAELRAIAKRNTVVRSMIGLGFYGTHTPPVIQRNVLENPAWYTAYTPYQAEISQGRLEAVLNFQTMVADLTGLPLANASLLDEASAAAEAMTLAQRVSKSKSTVFFVDRDTHPQTIAVLKTRAEPLAIEIEIGDSQQTDFATLAPFGALLSYPGSSGQVRDPSSAIAALRATGAVSIVATDLLALVLLSSPGSLGADVAIGSSQRFGVPLGYGGPHAAFLATREDFKRAVPGRIVGVSVDARGQPALRLALQTREQHIRREKATSNVCTAQVLLAVMAGLYAVYHGPEGLRTIAMRVQRLTAILAAGLARAPVQRVTEAAFDTLTFRAPGQADRLVASALAEGINIRRIDADHVGVSVDETTGRAEIEALWRAFGAPTPSLEALDGQAPSLIPKTLLRGDAILTHPTFHLYRSETEMLRYLRRLADKDIALDRAMIPLGSCTMKLNATTEMMPVTWPEFGAIHPFAPAEQAAGYRALIKQLEEMLAEITGYAAVSLQPNAGSQGEYAGLLAIRRYHLSRGDSHRTVCLIPSSAHGTNPASAAMAGMRVVVVACDDHGNVDLADLDAKLAEHGNELAALMVTYPSTHGVFETEIRRICDKVHDKGGQVYLDGANLNALVGTAKPGAFGSDVSHLNLHKTFCIPHGGGGPGVGPIGVLSHLAPFLPNHPLDPEAGPETGPGPLTAAPYGSAGILPISWTYIRLMGAEGLRLATETAILNANYIATRLAPHFPVLYCGAHGLVAHECIIDTRPLKESAGVTVDDIAKRLMDYGFHAPTMSWPVAGTLMIEPTESESKEEIDRFCDAMIAIRAEIRMIETGVWPREDNPLHNAPHTAEAVMADVWPHPYSRTVAAYPAGQSATQAKYWPPVARVDNAYGDRHVVCTCPPLEAYRDAAE